MAHAYAAMLGGPIPLSAYLRATPFSGPHFDIIMDSDKKPALGLEGRELREHCLSVRSGAVFAVPLSAAERADVDCLFE